METEEMKAAESAAQVWKNMQKADWYFRKVVRQFVKERDKVSVGGISLPCMLLLRKIACDGPARLGDLADEMDFTSGAITGMCDRLEKTGYARRIRPQDDRRTVLLAITSAGSQLLVRYHTVGVRCITALFAGLNDAELSALCAIFPKLLLNLQTFSVDVLCAVENAAQNMASTDAFPQSDIYLHY